RQVDLVCHQVDDTTGNFIYQKNLIHLDGRWWFLTRNKKEVRVFRGEAIPGSPRVQRKRPLPDIMAIVANARPDPSHDRDRNIGTWRIRVLKTAERSSKRREGETRTI
ncbi:unnamed protein product, partial [Sphacelaria rigidula]